MEHKKIICRLCTVNGCNRKHIARGYCHGHYKRWQKNGNVYEKEPLVQVERDILKRIKNKTKISKNGCWEWTGSKHKFGYGFTKYKGKTQLIHRLSAHLYNNFDLQSKKYILHKCDNPACFNPDHLYIGNHKQNMKDMVFRERSAKGEKHPNSKITKYLINKVISDYFDKNEKQYLIAKKYGISQSRVSALVTGKTWFHYTKDRISSRRVHNAN